MIDFLNSKDVAIFHSEQADYLEVSPYHPHERYPEYLFGDNAVSADYNSAYESVRNVFLMLGLDKQNFGNTTWNPLKEIISPGEKVVIKPNFVLDRHEKGGALYSVITHPSVLRAICDYVYLALEGEGRIIIADAPQADCDFEHLMKETGLEIIQEFYRSEKNFEIEVYDLRQLKLTNFYDSSTRILQDGDPLGYSIVDLKDKSEFTGLENAERIYGADYDRKEIVSHHDGQKNEYCIANTVLSADVIISVPKMKTHRKAGITLCMKNLVGINGNKNYLPHFRIGLPEDGGDEFPELTKDQKKVMYTNRRLKDYLLAKPSGFHDAIYQAARRCYHILVKIHPSSNSKDVIEGGSWSGNDTIWRMILDLNRIIIYADKDGKICDFPQRKFLMLADGLWAGEKEGPLEPDLKKAGIIAGGVNPLVMDIALCRLMGFEENKIPKLKNGMMLTERPISRADFQSLNIHLNNEKISDETKRCFDFSPPVGWRNE